MRENFSFSLRLSLSRKENIMPAHAFAYMKKYSMPILISHVKAPKKIEISGEL